MRRYAWTLTLWLWLWGASDAFAHPTPASSVFVELTSGGAHIEHNAPVEELERATHRSLLREGESLEQMLVREGAGLERYAAGHVQLMNKDGAAWTVRLARLDAYRAEDGPRVRFYFVASAPTWRSSEALTLRDTLIIHEVMSHYSRVFVKERADGAASANAPLKLRGVIRATQAQVELGATVGAVQGFVAVVKHGVHHILEGLDHLMFLFALLLVSPVSALNQRWSQRRSTRESVGAIVRLISAFTLGHSATLALGALGGVHAEAHVVEPLIALSVMAAAAHAIRPLFGRGEVVMAALFGLVHGLAFAYTLPPQGSLEQTLITQLGFNLGIELAQVGLVALVMPWVLLLAKTRAFDGFRLGGGALAGIFALGWFMERTLDLTNPLEPVMVWMLGNAPWLLVALVGAALASRAWAMRDSEARHISLEGASGDEVGAPAVS